MKKLSVQKLQYSWQTLDITNTRQTNNRHHAKKLELAQNLLYFTQSLIRCHNRPQARQTLDTANPRVINMRYSLVFLALNFVSSDCLFRVCDETFDTNHRHALIFIISISFLQSMTSITIRSKIKAITNNQEVIIPLGLNY